MRENRGGPFLAARYKVKLIRYIIIRWLVLAIAQGCLVLHGQQISFGVLGGTGLTRDFRTLRYTFPWEGTSHTDVSEAGPRSIVIGPAVEINLSQRWSVEGNALHRTLKYRVYSDFPGRVCAINTFCGGDVSTWQFPLLVKYRIPLAGKIKPFIAAGPSFRTHSNPSGARPSSYGSTAGAGIEIDAGPFYFTPTVRYTRWGADGLQFQPTIRNQVEVLGGIGYRTDSGTRHAYGRKVWLGLIAGVPITNDFPPVSPGMPMYTGESKRVADFRSVAGVMAEVELTRNVSVAVNGLYRRLHFDNRPEVVVTWQLPILAKFTFGNGPLRPFVEGGPSFRITGNLNNTDPGHYGLTAAIGAETRWRWLRLTPTVRYTRWSGDNSAGVEPQAFTKRDQVELLFGFSF